MVEKINDVFGTMDDKGTKIINSTEQIIWNVHMVFLLVKTNDGRFTRMSYVS